MGRDITWPAGEWDSIRFGTKVGCLHQCYESYRGYDESAQKQFGKRFVVDADGKVKKGFQKWTMLEGWTYAPTDYTTYKTVILEPGDFIIASLRSGAFDKRQHALAELFIFEVTEDFLKKLKTGAGLDTDCATRLEIKIDSFRSSIPDEEWIHQVPEFLHKAVRKAFKIPKRVLKSKD